MNLLGFLDKKILSSLNIQENDKAVQKFLMLIEGQNTVELDPIIEKYGYSRQRYYQLLRDFRQRGMKALVDKKPGPKSASLEIDHLTNWVIRYKFQDPKIAAAVIAQKLRQQGFRVSLRTIQGIIENYGLQKKTFTN